MGDSDKRVCGLCSKVNVMDGHGRCVIERVVSVQGKWVGNNIEWLSSGECGRERERERDCERNPPS